MGQQPPRDYGDIIDRPLPGQVPLSQEDIPKVVLAAYEGRLRGSVRIATGRIWPQEEYEDFRKRVLRTPLP